MFYKVKEECGVFGVFDNDGFNVASEAYSALYALQHRGQETCGIAVNDKGTIINHKDVGLVPDVFNEVILNHLKGQMAVGHVQYLSNGKPTREGAQPLVSKYIKGAIAITYNGSLINAYELRRDLENNGAIFQTTTDAEIIAYIIAKQRLSAASIEEAILAAMKKLKGTYCMVIMTPRKLIAVRDPNGLRPLCMGKIGNSVLFSSESCAIDSLGGKFVRDIQPGEVVLVTKDGIQSFNENVEQKAKLCIFEYVYFARPDSVIEGASVHLARQEAGRYLARQYPVEADLVIGVPDSGFDAAVGYANESKIPYGIGLIKNRYVGRTFIEPQMGYRENMLKIKINAISAAVKDKRVVIVDDSIVRGTTSKRIVSLLKEAGAKEVHLRISSPPFLFNCFFGTEIDAPKNFIANKMGMDQIAKEIGADTLGYLSVENLVKIPLSAKCDFCTGCFTGLYPCEVPKEKKRSKFERRLP
jgi:amidophosphoribosyltransferase